MASASHARWKAAQNAERKAFASWKLEEPVNHSQFFSQNFLLGSAFFNGKKILKVGCDSGATIHSIRQAQLSARAGWTPIEFEQKGYKLTGITGLRCLNNRICKSTFLGHSIVLNLTSYLSSFLAYFVPNFAHCALCVKQMWEL